MQAFHDDQKIKEKYLNRIIAHQQADEIVKGRYWENGKGCAVGCTIHSGNHKAYETELGIPIWMAHLEDRIFEGLPNERAKQWPKEFLEAITPGQNLEKVKIPMLIFIVESAREKFDHKKYPKQLDAINNVLTELNKNPINIQDLISARAADAADAAYAAYAAYAAAQSATTAAAAAAAADAAAQSAAYAAADAYAYVSAYASADAYAAAAAAAAAAADADAAYAAADAYAAAYAARKKARLTARENEYTKFADKLLDLIRENK